MCLCITGKRKILRTTTDTRVRCKNVANSTMNNHSMKQLVLAHTHLLWLCLLPHACTAQTNVTSHLAETITTDRGSPTSGYDAQTWIRCREFCYHCDATQKSVTCGKRTAPAKITLTDIIPHDVIQLNLSLCHKAVDSGLANDWPNTEPAAQTRQGFDGSSISPHSTNPINRDIDARLRQLKLLADLSILDLSCNDLHNIDVNDFPADLTQLHLRANSITQVDLAAMTSRLARLRKLDLGDNQLLRIGSDEFHNAHKTSRDELPAAVSAESAARRPALRHLVLRANQISAIPPRFLATFPALVYLDLSNNKITALHGDLFYGCVNLSHLNISFNPIRALPHRLFTDVTQLRSLHLRGLQIENIDSNMFSGLSMLQLLDLSFNTKLRVLRGDGFSGLESLETLDLRHCRLQTVHPASMRTLLHTLLISGNPLRCDCTLMTLAAGLANVTSQLPDTPRCHEPPAWRGQPVHSLLQANVSCTPAVIINVTRLVSYAVGAGAVLDCPAVGDPQPTITWRTPSGKILHYEPVNVQHDMTQPDQPSYHAGHHWHDTPRYHTHQQLAQHTQPLHLLRNGSLYIDYVTRTDAGRYRCTVRNEYGSDEVVIRVTLDYGAFVRCVLLTQVVGVSAAGAFLLFGLLLGLIRNTVSWCQIKHQENANRRIKEMLHTISDYKSAQMDRLSAYKTAKMDQLCAFKHSQIDRLHVLSRPSLGQGLQHMQSMREHYSTQIDVIRENCAEKADHLRANYALRMQRFRLYKSDKVGKLRGYKAEKVETLRENYSYQAQRIREYGAQQMAKLRRSYKLQQHYLLKLYELFDISNCMTVMEAECMRTESMLFDETFIAGLDLETHPVHIHMATSSDSDDSFYVTASSQSDDSLHKCTNKQPTAIDDNLTESASSDLGQDDLNFNDIELEPFPAYSHFLEAIDIETPDDHAPAAAAASGKDGKNKSKSKQARPSSIQLCVSSRRTSIELQDQPQQQQLVKRQSSKASAPKRCKSKAAAAAAQFSDSDDDDCDIVSTKQQRASLRRSRQRPKQQVSRTHAREVVTTAIDVTLPGQVLQDGEAELILRPCDLAEMTNNTRSDSGNVDGKSTSVMTSPFLIIKDRAQFCDVETGCCHHVQTHH